MRDWGKTDMCRAKKGLLFLHECGEPAVAQCHLCGCPVCMAHRTLDSVGAICPECYVQEDSDATDDGYDDQRPGWRERYYARHGYTPLSIDFSDGDYAAVEEESATGPAKGDISALESAERADRADGASDDLDHYLES